MIKTQRILELIQDVASELRVFEPRGPGSGNMNTNEAMARVNQRVAAEFGREVIECALSVGCRHSVDFYVPDEATVIEVEFSLRNPYPCLEKDAFKVLLAQDAGYKITTLILVGDPGCRKRISAPAPNAIIAWLKRKHDLDVRVVELMSS